MPFDRLDLDALPLEDVRAHGGAGTIGFYRVAERGDVEGQLNFIDVAVLPPGASVGAHTHAHDEEEFYLILDGAGRLVRNGEAFDVRAGMLIRNPPGATHELRNDGPGPLRVFVFEVRV